MNEKKYETLLNIQTSGEDKYHTSAKYHRYEPTPYDVLETLFNHYQLTKDDHIVDFGCGKGRLNFYIHHQFQAYVTGIEMNETYYQDAIHNQLNYQKKYPLKEEKIKFICCYAEEYNIDPLDNKFYFFNPFSIQILRKVIEKILISLEEHPRCVELIFYYPSDDYLYYLEHKTAFSLIHNIPLPNHHKNHRERFLVYQLSYV